MCCCTAVSVLWVASWRSFPASPLQAVDCETPGGYNAPTPDMTLEILVDGRKHQAVKKLGGLICQLLPLLFFYLGTWAAGIGMDTLTEEAVVMVIGV